MESRRPVSLVFAFGCGTANRPSVGNAGQAGRSPSSLFGEVRKERAPREGYIASATDSECK